MPRYANRQYNERRRAIMAVANGKMTQAQAKQQYQRTAANVAAALDSSATDVSHLSHLPHEETQPMEENSIALLDKMDAQNLILASIAESLATLAASSMPESPNYRYPFEAYAGGEWLSDIGAKAVESDSHGVTWVSWQGRRWRRHFADGDNGRPPSIWFSRSTADDDGKATWITLATFREISDAKPMSVAVHVQRHQQPPTPPEKEQSAPATNGNGNGSDFNGGELVTEPQRKAIGAISARLGADKQQMEAWLAEVSAGRTKYAQALTKDEASQLITRLNKM